MNKLSGDAARTGNFMIMASKYKKSMVGSVVCSKNAHNK